MDLVPISDGGSRHCRATVNQLSKEDFEFIFSNSNCVVRWKDTQATEHSATNYAENPHEAVACGLKLLEGVVAYRHANVHLGLAN